MYRSCACTLACSVCSCAGSPFLSPVFSSSDRHVSDSGVVYPGGSPTRMGSHADRGCFHGASPGGCDGADTCTTRFQQYRGSASHCGHFRALRRCRTLRIDWRVPRYTCCWRPPAYRCGFLAQMGTEASRTIPARRVAASTSNAVARTKGRASRFTRPWSKTMRVSLKQLVGKCASTMILLWRYASYGA